MGWYQVAELQWLYNWKVRAQVSVTVAGPDYKMGKPFPQEDRLRPGAQVFFGPEKVRFTVEGDVLEIVFPMPDCICRMRRAWGCSAGCPVRLGVVDHHCQATLIAKPPKPHCHLRREGKFLEFVETRLGMPRVQGRLENWKGPPKPVVVDLSRIPRTKTSRPLG